MSRRLWLLLEWLGESDISLFKYGVVNTDSLIGDEANFDVGKTIFVPANSSKSAKRAKILRISEKKRDVKELKILLEKQDSQMKNFFSMCMNALTDMKTSRTMFLDSQSNGADDTDSSSDDDGNHVADLNFTKQTNKITFNGSRLSASRHHNSSGNNQTPFSNRRTLTSSTPFLESTKLTFDQGTQTDETLDANVAKIEQLELLLKRLYQQFLSLIGEARTNDLQPTASLEYSETEVSEMEHHVQQPEEASIRDHGEISGVEGPTNTSHVDSNENKSTQAKRLCIRRASAQTTNTGLPNLDISDRDSDMVTLGGGVTKLPVTVLNGIDWNCYTTATRQLLKAIFPRKVLATHSLTGKQSPAFTNKPPKKALDAKIVNDIVDTVSDVCGVSKRCVRSCITTKCTDEAKLYRNRQLYKQNHESRGNQENTAPSSPSSNEIITKKE